MTGVQYCNKQNIIYLKTWGIFSSQHNHIFYGILVLVLQNFFLGTKLHVKKESRNSLFFYFSSFFGLYCFWDFSFFFFQLVFFLGGSCAVCLFCGWREGGWLKPKLWSWTYTSCDPTLILTLILYHLNYASTIFDLSCLGPPYQHTRQKP